MFSIRGVTNGRCGSSSLRQAKTSANSVLQGVIGGALSAPASSSVINVQLCVKVGATLPHVLLLMTARLWVVRCGCCCCFAVVVMVLSLRLRFRLLFTNIIVVISVA